MRISLIIAMAALPAATAALLRAQDRTSEFETVATLPEAAAAGEAHEAALHGDPYDRMTVEVRLGNRGPYHFLVDTGSERTAVSKELAASLGLAPAGKARLHSVTGVAAVTTVAVPSLEIGGRTVEVSHAPLLYRTHIGADGILGIDTLRAQRLLLDFTSATMEIVPSAQRISREERNAIVVEARRRSGRLIVTRARADKIPVTIVIDTGTQVSVANEPLRRALARRRALPELGKVALVSVTGQTLVGDYMILKALDLGKLSLAELPVVFADAYGFKPLGLEHKPAILLGMNGLRGFDRLSIDFERKELRVSAAPTRAPRAALVSPAGIEPATY